jgi:putative ABC transport system permease protein
MLGDLRYALRMMARTPGFTAILVVTLAIGIGASTTIFSVVNSVLLRPLPYPEPDRLARIYTEFHGGKMTLPKFWVSYPEFEDFKRDCRTCESVGAYRETTVSLSGGDRPVRVDATLATHTLLPTIGVKPLFGRLFDASEDLPGDPKVIVLGYDLWKSVFAGDPEILGKTIQLDARPVTVIGVMPQGFDFHRKTAAAPQAWIPFCVDPANQSRGGHNFNVIARLEPGASMADLNGEIAGLMNSWSAGKGPGSDHYIGLPKHPMIMVPLHEDTVGSMSSALWLLQGAVLLVLLIAIVNVANLLLARAESRNREVAVRFALGAGRGRLIRQFLTESLALGVLGGALGVLFAVWAVDGIKALIPSSAPRAAEITLDSTALLFAVGCTLVSSLLFGLAPILHTRRTDVHGSLKDGGPRTTGSRGRLRLRRGLVIGEVALAVVLVVGCSLMIRSFLRLQQVDLGFKPDHLLTFNIDLPAKTYPDVPTAHGFWRRAQERLRALPGVKGATVMWGVPPWRPIVANDLSFPDRTPSPDGPNWNTDYWQAIGDDGFDVLGMKIVKGRALDSGDSLTAPPVVVINQTFADKFFPGEDPIGKRLRTAGWEESLEPQTVVGVVADVKQAGIDKPAGTEIFYAVEQSTTITGPAPERQLFFVLRTEGDPAAVMPSVSRAIASIDPTLPTFQVRTMDDILWEAVARPRFLTLLLTAFAIMALLLAAIGIYGVMSHTVAQRTHEIGVRVALGAQPATVRRMVLRQGAVLAAIGVVVGAGIAVTVEQLLAKSLGDVVYGTRTTHPILLAGVIAAVLLASLLATWVPALRATRVEPTVALREE